MSVVLIERPNVWLFKETAFHQNVRKSGPLFMGTNNLIPIALQCEHHILKMGQRYHVDLHGIALVPALGCNVLRLAGEYKGIGRTCKHGQEGTKLNELGYLKT